jgi:hypothetical protein
MAASPAENLCCCARIKTEQRKYRDLPTQLRACMSPPHGEATASRSPRYFGNAPWRIPIWREQRQKKRLSEEKSAGEMFFPGGRRGEGEGRERRASNIPAKRPRHRRPLLVPALALALTLARALTLPRCLANADTAPCMQCSAEMPLPLVRGCFFSGCSLKHRVREVVVSCS